MGIDTLVMCWISNESNPEKPTRRAQTIAHTKNYTKVVVPFMEEKYKGARIMVEILEMRRERKQKTTDNENMETGVKIHHPVGSRISMTLDEVTLRNKQDRHQTNKTKKNTTTKFEQIKGDTKKEDEFDALYTDGPMVASIPASKTDSDACCGGDSQGKTSCCGGSDSNSKESTSLCCGGDDSKDSK